MKSINCKYHLLVSITLSLGCFVAPANADWGVVVGVGNSNNEYENNNEIMGLLGAQYRGEKFNIGKDGLSYDITNSNNYAFEVLLDSKNVGYKAKDHKTFTGMSERKNSIDIGARAIVNTGFLGSAVIDITKDINASKGYQANFKLGGITPHASHWNGKKEVVIAAMTGLRYQDSKVTDYYYGVKSSEATATRRPYKAKSAFTPYFGVEAQANLTPHTTLEGGVSISKRAKSIRNSSITDNRKYDVGVNFGFTYWF